MNNYQGIKVKAEPAIWLRNHFLASDTSQVCLDDCVYVKAATPCR